MPDIHHLPTKDPSVRNALLEICDAMVIAETYAHYKKERWQIVTLPHLSLDGCASLMFDHRLSQVILSFLGVWDRPRLVLFYDVLKKIKDGKGDFFSGYLHLLRSFSYKGARLTPRRVVRRYGAIEYRFSPSVLALDFHHSRMICDSVREPRLFEMPAWYDSKVSFGFSYIVHPVREHCKVTVHPRVDDKLPKGKSHA